MQDIHSIGGGRIFVGGGGGGGAGGGGDRRLRPHSQHHPQALKCPRCESLNTKFCYYNNYNLSQPRHFCKNCRRYWTKGGVLRNVPVGGGCRKTKRSKPKSSAPADSTTVAQETAAETAAEARDCKSGSHSSSESSSLTATTAAPAMEAVSATSSIAPSNFFNFTEYKSMITQSMNNPQSNHGFTKELLEQSSGCGLFPEMGNFSSMIASSAEPPLPFGFNAALDQTSQWSQQQAHEQKTQPGGEILLDQTVQIDLPDLQTKPSGNEAFGPLDWQPAADQGLYDLPSADDQAYWSQNSHQWADEDHQQPGLYLP